MSTRRRKIGPERTLSDPRERLLHKLYHHLLLHAQGWSPPPPPPPPPLCSSWHASSSCGRTQAPRRMGARRCSSWHASSSSGGSQKRHAARRPGCDQQRFLHRRALFGRSNPLLVRSRRALLRHRKEHVQGCAVCLILAPEVPLLGHLLDDGAAVPVTVAVDT